MSSRSMPECAALSNLAFVRVGRGGVDVPVASRKPSSTTVVVTSGGV